MMNTDYFHPKTTPDLPVRIAVRMSLAIPGIGRIRIVYNIFIIFFISLKDGPTVSFAIFFSRVQGPLCMFSKIL